MESARSRDGQGEAAVAVASGGAGLSTGGWGEVVESVGPALGPGPAQPVSRVKQQEPAGVPVPGLARRAEAAGRRVRKGSGGVK